MVQNAECAGVFTGRHPFTPRLTLTLREVLAWVQAKRQELTMLLKVGDLAKRCGLTVRMLHHYDSIGLLTPRPAPTAATGCTTRLTLPGCTRFRRCGGSACRWPMSGLSWQARTFP